jgi:hypothetical protein
MAGSLVLVCIVLGHIVLVRIVVIRIVLVHIVLVHSLIGIVKKSSHFLGQLQGSSRGRG